MNLTIRRAVPSDAPALVAFNEMMARETEGISLDPARLRNGVEALFEDQSRGVYYVAETDGKIVGQLMITYEWSDWRNGTFWWIQSVYTDKNYRNKGVFRALYRHVESLARSRNDVCGLRLYVEEHNGRAQKTYESLGLSQCKYRMMEVDFVMRK
jgi:GNAT superfamily N-acetyltransferase